MKTYNVTVDEQGTTRWYLDDKLHRENGPAVEYVDSSKKWFLDGKLHRENGPAIERVDGTKMWFLDGKRHRAAGPAIERADGTKEWFLNGVKLSGGEFLKRTKSTTCEGKVVEVDGVKYRLTAV